MKIRCEDCMDVLVSTPENRWCECLCKSIYIDTSFDNKGNAILHRYGYLKEGARMTAREDI